MLLKDLKGISDEQKIEYFDDLLEYANELLQKNAEFLILKHRLKAENAKYLKEQEKLLEREIDKKVTAKMQTWKRQKVKELDKEEWRAMYLKTQKEISKARWDFENEKAAYRNSIVQEMAEAQKEKHPMLKLSSRQWKSRTKIYPQIMTNPEKTNKSIALDLKTSELTVEQARNELIASWEILNNKIWLVKRIVTRAAMSTEKAQEVLLDRLINAPDTIANKDLISAIKNNAALYSLFVWAATDSNWWVIKKEDQKILDEVLWNHLE